MVATFNRQRLFPLVLLLGAIWLTPPALAQNSESRPPIPIDEWLRGPDRRDFPWKIHLLPPRLTFQQRYLEEIRVAIPANALKKNLQQRDLHFLVKVANKNGLWFKNDNYTHFAVPPNLDAKNEIQFGTGVYLRPGDYTFAVLAYDSVHEERNLWRGGARVPLITHDPLPQLDRELPAIEFIRDFPQDTLRSDMDARWMRGGPLRPSYRGRLAGLPEYDEETWNLGHGREWLPVPGAQPVLIDLIMNFSESIDLRLGNDLSAATLRQNAGRLLQVGNVLSQLNAPNGCIRLSAVDMLRMQIILDRADARGFDWDNFQETIRGLDRNTVDVDTLSTHSSPSAFFHDFLMSLISDGGACGSYSRHPVHVIVIAVSNGLQFPKSANIEPMQPSVCQSCRFYYLRPEHSWGDVYDVVERSLRPEDRAGPQTFDDHIERMLKPLRPKLYTLSNPHEFRKILAAIIADLRAHSSASGDASQVSSQTGR